MSRIMKSAQMMAFSVLALSMIAVVPAQLVIYASGTKNIQGPTLTDGLVFCPHDRFAKGFSIKCIESDSATWAKFFVNGNFVKREGAKPFFIAGDRDGRIKQWKDWELFRGRDRVITCQQSDGTVSSATISLICDSDVETSTSPTPSSSTDPSVSPSPDPSVSPSTDPTSNPSTSTTASPSASASATSRAQATPSVLPTSTSEVTPSPSPPDGTLAPGTLLLHPSGVIGDSFIPIIDGMNFCPDIFPTGRFTVQCVESTDSTRAVFYVNSVVQKSEGAKPYFIAGDKGGKAAAWLDYPVDEIFSLGCHLNDGTNSEVALTVKCDDIPDPSPEDGIMPGDGVLTSSSGCVVIDAKATTLSEDWYETDEGIVFRPHVDGTYVAKAGLFPISYKFTAPLTAQFAFVLDMTTAHSTEHNDVWAWFPTGGFQLTRGVINEDERKGQGWTKVYHNSNKRDCLASSIDFSPHSMATKEVLEEGVEYEILLSGRSSKLEVHRIIMFPCSGIECQRNVPGWRRLLAECKAL